jgi:hypothetical protein
MSILPQLEQDLLEAANRRRAAGAENGAEPSRPRLSVRGRVGGLRLPLIALGCLLASATIALAASGVILTGAPVRPEGPLNPSVGEGAPAPGASRLLPVRVPDPEGGLPWGMRIVHTTRGEVCLQIGRVEDGQLGQLGVDGVFHDDGRFHPMPADVLPGTIRLGASVEDNDATATVSCYLAGQVVVGDYRGVDRSAGGANGHERVSPRSQLRDIYFGMLGAPAVSVSFRAGEALRTVAVLQPLGVYLIVRRAARAEQVGIGGAGVGTEGDLHPSPPLTTITYRLDGQLCQRGPVEPPGTPEQIAHPCPRPHWPSVHEAPPRDLNRPLHVRLQVNHYLITGAKLSFTAPFAITSAKQDYVIRIPSVSCRDVGPRGRPGVVRGYDEASLDRDVARGSTVTHRFSGLELFAGVCGLPSRLRHVSRRSATIEVLYHEREGVSSVLVGSITVHEPPGTRPAPEPAGPARHH